MVLTKILKRRDAASVVVAVFLAQVLLQLLQTITNKWAVKLSHVNYGPIPYHWKEDLLMPIVWALLMLILLEILCWVYVWFASGFNKK